MSFGLNSGVVATLGLIYELNSPISSKSAIIWGRAIADSLSDVKGVHMSIKTTGTNHKDVKKASKLTSFSKFFVALNFLVPF